MSRLHPVVVVHYHEISLKRGNRPLFLRQLARNLARAVADVGPVAVRQRPGRIVLDLEGRAQPELVLERTRRVCGVASVLLGYRTAATLEAMRAVIGGLIEGRRFASFRITARRAFKTYPMTSVELNRALKGLGSPPARLRFEPNDHQTDALVTAAGMRALATHEPRGFAPAGLTPHVARTEGWTFGVL